MGLIAIGPMQRSLRTVTMVTVAVLLAIAGVGTAAKAETYRDCPHCPLMAKVPGGSFMMGSTAEEIAQEGMTGWKSVADEVPRHAVNVKGFSLGAFEVTRDEFAAFVRATNHRVEGPCVLQEQSGRWTRSQTSDWRNPGFVQDGRHPVVCVSWNDATAYASWLSKQTNRNYRLPTEAEWEYAARAGTSGFRYWGPLNEACNAANAADRAAAKAFRWLGDPFPCDDGYVYTAPVGQFRPNAFGLYDMLGNVWEWAENCYVDSYEGAPTDGSAWPADCNSRVTRGGSWMDSPSGVRASTRTADGKNSRFNFQGFRVARSD